MSVIYLFALAVSIGGMVLIDRAGRLVFWKTPFRAAIVLIISVGFFLAWDFAGISSGIFLRGESPIATGIVLAPELPLEEPIFLAFLVYLTMVLLGLVRRVASRRRLPSGDDA